MFLLEIAKESETSGTKKDRQTEEQGVAMREVV
jgi:hypothetical protein